MRHTLIARLTAVLIAVVATAAIVTVASRQGETAVVEATRATITTEPVSAAVVPVSAGPEQDAAPATTAPTTTVAPTTTTAPPTTVPPTTAPPATAPPTTAPPTTAPPAPVAAPAPAPAPSASFSPCERELFDRMNRARTDRGIAPLAADGRIVPVSRSWSNRLAQLQDLLHNPNYGSQVFAAAPEATRAAENVGRNSGSVLELFDAFMASPGHRDAILASGHTHAGVGCTVDSAGQRWAAVNFWG